MHHFIDRRPNPKGKSLGNRQRFLRRARKHLKEMIDTSIRVRSIKESSTKGVIGGEKVTIPAKGIREPRFVHSDKDGVRRRVFAGNKKFVVGDRIARPTGNGDAIGRKASSEGEGEDGFSFTLTKDEYLDLLFEGLELPDLVKKSIAETETAGRRHAGITTVGTPANLNLIRTMRISLGRRLALSRPSLTDVETLEDQITMARHQQPLNPRQTEVLEEMQRRLDGMISRRKFVGYIDPLDLRFNTRVPEITKNSKAVVFCLMDVSGSMQEREKDLAKRFFILLHLFLERRYDQTDIVFIRHSHTAQEVDEDTFFYANETGGTIVSTALVKMQDVIQERYPSDEWNIYGAQASDGENFGNDSENCEGLLNSGLLRLCQFYAYVEIIGENDTGLLTSETEGAELWQAYRRVKKHWPNFEMQRVADTTHIYPVFRALFAARTVGAAE